MRTFPTITLASILLILILATCYAATTTKDSSSATTYDASSSRRERNLDHWDAETLAAYLGMDPTTGQPLPTSTSTTASSNDEPIDQYVGHDAAIMFYAQWCPNCHQLAPIWDAIASLLNAGSKKSNLIMALFDCEKDTIHMKLCSSAGVTHYPTLMFVGSGPIRDTDPLTSAIVGKDKSAGPAGATVLERAVKFQGNLGYSESIMDWIRTMQGLSSWHKLTESGALRFVRDGFLGFLFRKKSGNKGGGVDVDSLPVGVPPTFRAKQASSSAADGGASMADVLQNKALETKLKTAQDEKAKMEKLATHASLLLDNVLCPEKPTSAEIGAATIANQEPPTYRDAYATLYNTNGWEAKATLQTDKTPAQAMEGKTMEQITTELLRTCTIELSLDYCTRVSTHVTNDFLDELAAMSSDDGELNEYPSMLELEKELVAKIEKDEPYCASFDECLKNDFDKDVEVCRPKSCPFRNEVACRYVSSCFIESIQDEYGVALGYLEEEGGIGSLKSLGEAMELAAASSDATASGGGGGGWGFAK